MQERPEHDDEICPTLERPCFMCHITSVRLGTPRDFPTRTPSKGAPRGSTDSYRAGVPVSHRPDGSVMPYLRPDGDVMYQREFDQKRHLIEETKRKATQVGLAPSSR